VRQAKSVKVSKWSDE